MLCILYFTDRYSADPTIDRHVPGHFVPAHRRRHSRVVLLRAGRRPETPNVNGVQNEHRAHGIVVRVASRAHPDRHVPGGTHIGHCVPVSVWVRFAQAGSMSDHRQRNAQLGGRRGLLRPERRSLGQHR